MQMENPLNHEKHGRHRGNYNHEKYEGNNVIQISNCRAHNARDNSERKLYGNYSPLRTRNPYAAISDASLFAIIKLISFGDFF